MTLDEVNIKEVLPGWAPWYEATDVVESTLGDLVKDMCREVGENEPFALCK